MVKPKLIIKIPASVYSIREMQKFKRETKEILRYTPIVVIISEKIKRLSFKKFSLKNIPEEFREEISKRLHF